MSPIRRLIVVGGGILGTMHAVQGIKHGFEVIQLERDVVPRGASVRNFGLIWVGGRASGAELDLALRAREMWGAIAKDNPRVTLRSSGSLTIARSGAELAVLEAAAAGSDAKDREFVLMDPDRARAINPALVGPFLGALFCGRDAIVEPRNVLAALRDRLREHEEYQWMPGRHIVDVRSHCVVDHTGAQYEGDLVVCCIGARTGGVLEEALQGAPLRRVRLQMLETKPFAHELSTALADGDSLRYYPAYGEVAAKLPSQSPLAADWGAQLLLVKRMSGHLTIGDTHSYEEPFAFDISDAPYEHLLGVATALLGSVPPVERRWAGVYCQVTDDDLLYFRKEIEPGVVIVTGPGGRGMTMSPAIAEETFL